jgi:hypothetical protein
MVVSLKRVKKPIIFSIILLYSEFINVSLYVSIRTSRILSHWEVNESDI